MQNNLLSLLQLTDLTLPIGGFAHSAGLETYVQKGIVKDSRSAAEFIRQMLSQNIRYTDAAFASLAYDAGQQDTLEKVIELDIECTAVKMPKEIREASHKLGIRLIKNFQSLINNALVNEYREAIQLHDAKGHYCIAFGLVASALSVYKKDALSGFYYNAAAGMVTNSVKLIPLGQQDGQEILFSLHPLITELAEASLHPEIELLGLCCPGFDIRCMQHETLYSRLYMS